MKNENGSGSVYKLSGKRRKAWIAVVTKGYDKDGKQIRKSLGTFETKAKGQKALYEYNQNPNLFKKVTFGEIKKRWWERKQSEYKNERSKNTAINKIKHLDGLDNYDIKDLKLIVLQNYFDNLKCSNSQKKFTKGYLEKIFEYASKYDLVSNNKIKFIEIGKIEKVIERKIFTRNEIEILKKNTEKIYCRYILILIYTGMRIGELLSLKISDINLKDKIIRVTDSKTSAGIRIIPIPNLILDYFYTENKNYFIETKNHTQLAYPAFRKKFKKILSELHIQVHTIHDTRHTFASMLSNTNANESNITRLIGHSDFKTTDNIYIHKDIEELRKTINMLN